MFALIPKRIEQVKKRLLTPEGLVWTDLLVLCETLRLQDEIYQVRPMDLIQALEMNRGWVYQSLARLRKKGFIQKRERAQEAALISVSGWGRVLLFNAEECYMGIDAYSKQDDSQVC